MSSRFRRLALLLLSCAAAAAAHAEPLRVCADPDNLPFSNQRQQGFENAVAQLIGAKLNRAIQYKWRRHSGRGFVRNVLNEKECDVLIGVPEHFEALFTTAPYYTSSYVFVTQK